MLNNKLANIALLLALALKVINLDALSDQIENLFLAGTTAYTAFNIIKQVKWSEIKFDGFKPDLAGTESSTSFYIQAISMITAAFPMINAFVANEDVLKALDAAFNGRWEVLASIGFAVILKLWAKPKN